jgi:hypothetical protein
MLVPISQTAPFVPMARVCEGSKKDVPQRQVRIVVVVQALLVMHEMAFGTLEDKAEPVRSSNVPVIEELPDST